MLEHDTGAQPGLAAGAPGVRRSNVWSEIGI